MRGLSLWQPWAAAVALKDKADETRPKRTSYRGPIAICSAKKWDDELEEVSRRLGALVARDPSRYLTGPSARRGVVVAIANLIGCEVMTEDSIAAASAQERALGNWQPGRFAWKLSDVRRLADPYPILGKQGLWKLPPEQVKSIYLLAGLLPAIPTPLFGDAP